MPDLQSIIIASGYLGIFITIFAESGFLFGFFLPGDSLLFSLGLAASAGIFNVWTLLVLVIVAAILGDSFGYYVGKALGPKLFVRDDSLFFKKKYVDDTKRFFDLYGAKAIVFARFVPIARTFVPILAGVSRMNYRIFLLCNIFGGVVWSTLFILGSFYLGARFPWIKDNAEYIILGILVVSFIPVIRHLFIAKKTS